MPRTACRSAPRGARSRTEPPAAPGRRGWRSPGRACRAGRCVALLCCQSFSPRGYDEPAMNIELRHLRYFVAVAEEASFTAAAHRVHVAQQALSTQIRQLEGAVG